MLQKEPKTLKKKRTVRDKLTRERDGGTFWNGVSNTIMDGFGDEAVTWTMLREKCVRPRGKLQREAQWMRHH
jgi:hypothetical protein